MWKVEGLLLLSGVGGVGRVKDGKAQVSGRHAAGPREKTSVKR